MTTTKTTASYSCSVERGAVKYLRDAGSGKINWTPKVATIATLQKIPALLVTYAARTTPEMQVYTVRGVRIKLVKVESDGDYHGVIADAQGRTMIVEIPSPTCVKSAHLPSLAADRAALLGGVGRTVDVTGVFFLDFAHGQTGHAPNYAELHPVTKLVLR